ncbi:MAG TPA: SGNH/GDSL hydrolase family protein [Chloroflexota bacterium]|nr:SGNH/GDSL hydrolase family protein [Chloroflexota bacterium]
MALIFQRNQKLVFAGDSITDCGRRDRAAPLGNGYVREVYVWLGAAYPELNLRIVNQGISGNTTRTLLARWDADVIAEQPDWLAIKIGVNDVWRIVTERTAEAVPLNEFERNYRAMLDRARAATRANLILIEPFLVETDRSDLFRRLLDDYRTVVRRLAGEYNTLLVKTQDAFDRGLQAQPASYWAGDRVHPTEIGHALIAREFLKVSGVEG